MHYYLLGALICAVLSGAIAESKNQYPFGWAVIALLLGPLAVILAAVQKPLPEFARRAVPTTEVAS